MKLFEYEAKEILARYGITVPRGAVASSPVEVEEVAREIGGPVALKSQVLVAGRGKAGGIVFADNAVEAGKAATGLIGSDIKGSLVRQLLVEEKLDITREFYASVAVDRQARRYVVLVSTEGGVDIEETALASPDKIARCWVDPITGFNKTGVEEELSGQLEIGREDAIGLADIIATLYTVALDCDAELVELNPLGRTESGGMVAADARIIIDDNALFRHPELTDSAAVGFDDTTLEAEARRSNLAYVDLDGDIGIVGNGAGLVMATLDLVYHFGGRPANFLDIGGGGSLDITRKGVLLVMSRPEVKAVLVNILGGITRCDVVAQAVIEALNESSVKKPVVVRMMGTNEAEGNRMLREAGINSYPDMEKAIEEIVKL
ncbi:MAG: ADP-forming succinate--CoA ligase subunit beta [Dehalococcoidales bacterium]|nr:MAG: ADP-forming succinate--CoA ligase subunit beta [Dehalococcoidales bacterium]